MALQIGIVGLPNVGKSTLFNALTGSRGAQAANYPFCTIDPNVGIVEVPDERLRALEGIVHPERTVPAAVEFVDIAGLVKGASKGEGLGNKFLAAIREVHAICHVVRAFKGGDIIHVDGSVEPKRDRETIEMELILADLDHLAGRMDKLAGAARTGDKEKIKELALLTRVKAHLDTGKVAFTCPMEPEERVLMKQIPLLTGKPIIYAVNVAEEELASADAEDMKRGIGLTDNEQLVILCAKIEEDLQDLGAEERKEYLQSIGAKSGLDQLIRAAYAALGYATYFTAGEKEVRAWTITKGMAAPQAAGVIHTDFEKGFIRAETVAFSDFIANGGWQGAKEAGKQRSEGKEYIVQDGDVLLFKFNV
jgi:hypothetical protein